MIRYAISIITDRSDHPLLLGLLVAAGALLLVSFTIEQVQEPGVWSGFLAVYALMALVMGLFGYAVLFALKAAVLYQKQRLSESGTRQ